MEWYLNKAVTSPTLIFLQNDNVINCIFAALYQQIFFDNNHVIESLIKFPILIKLDSFYTVWCQKKELLKN